VVDDDAPVRRMLERSLAAEGFAVEAAADGGAALSPRSARRPTSSSSTSPCRARRARRVPRLRAKGLPGAILMLTARDAVPDRVAGLEAGADDYSSSRSRWRSSVARLHALARRGRDGAEQLAFADLSLDLRTRWPHAAGGPSS
jgi:two-component system response regulator MprA